MNYQNKTKEVLIKELQKLQQEHDSLKSLYEKDITASKKVEASLKQALEWKEEIFEGSRDAIFISAPDSRFVAVNNAACDLTGYSRDQLLNMQIPNIHDLPDLDAYKMYHKRIFDGEEILSKAKILRSDGTKADTEFNNRCVLIAGKLYMHTTARNVTERKQSEEALRSSETRYRELFNNISSGVAIYEVRDNGNDFIFRDFNRAGERIDGDRKEDIIGKSIFEVRPGINKFGLLKVFRRVFETGISEHYPVKFYEDEKLKAWYDNFVYRLPSGEIVAVYDNITERKQVEEALQQEKENFRHSLDDSPLGVRIATIEGNAIYANKTILDFYGYDSLRELQKTHLKDRYTPESYARAQKRKHQREHGDFSATEYEINIVRKNGEIRHLQVYRNEVLWNGARQFQVIYKDITVRKQVEEELRNSKELLEKLNQHLQEVRENERAVISREIHDELGQSLTALKLDLNRMHKYLNTNPEAVTKLESMIELVSNTIKDVQRISSDLRPGILDELGLVSAIEWYCDEFEKRTGIKCNLKLDDSDYDDSQINLTFFRVLQETLTNVIRHAKASSVIIKLHKLIKGATMTIHDNGIGIQEEKIRSTKSFGLISMRERVKQFNGTIDISSKKDYGTKLVIFIPS